MLGLPPIRGPRTEFARWNVGALRGLRHACVDLVAEDPGAAVGARSQTTLQAPGDLHDPDGVSAAYRIAAAILQL